MNHKTALFGILVFVIGFSLGYFISIPNHITFDLNLDDNFIRFSENMKNISSTIYKEELRICEYNFGFQNIVSANLYSMNETRLIMVCYLKNNTKALKFNLVDID